MTVSQVNEVPKAIWRDIFEFLQDNDLGSCLLVCRLWSNAVVDLQKDARRQLECRWLWVEYLDIRFPYMSEVFTPIYHAEPVVVSPRQAYLDYNRYHVLKNSRN
jgi:F-box domain